jgi:quinol monooxygenase YgiN
MALCMIFEPGITQEQYDRVREQAAPGNRPPPGLLYHVAGPIEGGWRVVEVWESQEAFERFFNEKLGQALQQVGMPSLEPQVFPVHNTMER